MKTKFKFSQIKLFPSLWMIIFVAQSVLMSQSVLLNAKVAKNLTAKIALKFGYSKRILVLIVDRNMKALQWVVSWWICLMKLVSPANHARSSTSIKMLKVTSVICHKLNVPIAVVIKENLKAQNDSETIWSPNVPKLIYSASCVRAQKRGSHLINTTVW